MEQNTNIIRKRQIMTKTVFIVALREEVNHSTQINNCPIIFSGIGKINASLASFKAYISGFDKVINIGSCGSLNHSPGEIIHVGEIIQDIDATPLTDYSITPFERDGGNIKISESQKICFTTDYFYDLKQHSKYSPSYLEMIKKCDIFDMECFAIAKICRYYGMDFESYKWISDSGDHIHWEKNNKIGFERLKDII
jgi:adenosylhomocysteine nucleosidase